MMLWKQHHVCTWDAISFCKKLYREFQRRGCWTVSVGVMLAPMMWAPKEWSLPMLAPTEMSYQKRSPWWFQLWNIPILLPEEIESIWKKKKVKKSVSHSVVSDCFAIPWTVSRQAPLSMGFSWRDYWSGLPFPLPRDLLDSGSNLGFLHCRQILYCLSYQGS